MSRPKSPAIETLKIIALMLFAYVTAQVVLNFMHEDLHSIVAWLTGNSSTRFTVVWGSGLRFLPLYPDPTWKAVFFGIAGFMIWLAVAGCRFGPIAASIDR